MPSIAKLLKANDKYRGLLQSPWHPGDTVLYLDAVPNNVPTILVAGLGTEKETVFQVEEKTISSVTGVTRLRGANVELDILTPLVCLNNEEFLNQYSAFSENLLNPRGVYSATTEYIKGDIVSYTDGSTYMAITTTTGNAPTDTTYWTLISQKGEQGEQGVQGVQGDKGDKGDQGIQGIQGEQGIQGVQGEKGSKGDTGASITSASFSGDDIQFIKDDATTITLTGAKTTLKGDQGIQGEQGIQGIQGVQGEKGDTGAQGIQGVKGDKGDTGTGITEQAIGFTFTGGTTPKTLTVASDASVSGTNTGDEDATSIKTKLGISTLSGSNTGDQTLPVKATGAELNTGTDDDKFATAKALADSDYAKISDITVTPTSTTTFTNKRINPRIVTATSYTTDTGTSLDVSTCDEFDITALAGNLKFNNPSGTPVNGQKLIIRVKDNGTARALTYDTQFRASSGLALPATTIVSKTLYMGFIFNSADTKWDLLAVLNNF